MGSDGEGGRGGWVVHLRELEHTEPHPQFDPKHMKLEWNTLSAVPKRKTLVGQSRLRCGWSSFARVIRTYNNSTAGFSVQARTVYGTPLRARAYRTAPSQSDTKHFVSSYVERSILAVPKYKTFVRVRERRLKNCLFNVGG